MRHNSRLHYIGLGARPACTPISLLIDDLHIRIIHRHTGALIRELILDPTRDYQPRGLPPGPPKQTAATPRRHPDAGHLQKCNDVSRHLLTVSRGITESWRGDSNP